MNINGDFLLCSLKELCLHVSLCMLRQHGDVGKGDEARFDLCI